MINNKRFSFRDSFLNILAWFLTIITFDVLRLRRKISVQNLELVYAAKYSRSKRISIARYSYYYFIRNILDFVSGYNTQNFEKVTIIGRQHIDKALSEGKGAIILSSHLGNFEFQASATSILIRKSHAFVKRVGGKRMTNWIMNRRKKNGFCPIIVTERGEGTRAMVDMFKNNEMLGFIMDQARTSSPYLDFLGKPARTNLSVAKWSLKADTPIVPSYCKRLPNGFHELRFYPEIIFEKKADVPDEVLINERATILNQSLAAMINECPEQYFWMHRRWK